MPPRRRCAVPRGRPAPSRAAVSARRAFPVRAPAVRLGAGRRVGLYVGSRRAYLVSVSGVRFGQFGDRARRRQLPRRARKLTRAAHTPAYRSAIPTGPAYSEGHPQPHQDCRPTPARTPATASSSSSHSEGAEEDGPEQTCRRSVDRAGHQGRRWLTDQSMQGSQRKRSLFGRLFLDARSHAAIRLVGI